MKPTFAIVVAFALAATTFNDAIAQNRVDFSASQSELTGSMSDWIEITMALSQIEEQQNFTLLFEQSRRFGQSDLYGEMRYGARVERADAYIAIGGAPDADFRPELAIKAGLAWPVAAPRRWLFDSEISLYTEGVVKVVRAGVEQDFSWRETTVQVRAIAVEDDGVYAGFTTSAEMRLAPGCRWRVGYTDAPEVWRGTVLRVKSFNTAALIELGDRFSIRIDAATEDRGAYNRHTISLGGAWRF